MSPRIEEDDTLTELMRRWNELEPWRCAHTCVRVVAGGGPRHYVCRYRDDSVAGTFDRQRIAMAVRVACEEKGWILRVQDWPSTDYNGRRNTHATVQRYTGEQDFRGHPATEMRHGDGRCRTAAIVEAYVEMLSDYPEEADD